ncbi:MAG: enoyl-CoA hydratase/isomerase family protein [Ectothiorhodospiraceae bacterium]|nr:enoyl-CoA hydratase/isomerase family protein [Ectothiorhodospiraceae bacterium]MCH8503296.1 enoyl-CoA hydratase/isomerase family protein [Ectothiorhodospiraceae bacterium]
MQTSEAPVVLTTCEGITEIRVNRSQRMNTLNTATAEAFLDAVTSATTSKDTRVIVLTGAGDAFMAGGDLAEMRDAGDAVVETIDAIIGPMHQAMLALANAPQPTLASVHGAVAGAGVSLALGTDLAIAADNARFNLAYINIGGVPDCSGSWTLPRMVGQRKAMEIALLGDIFDASEALRLGLVNRVVPAQTLAEETRKLAERLASKAPTAMRFTRALIRQGQDCSLAEQLHAEEAAFKACAGTEDFREALAAFFEKRAPVFHGR